MPPELESHLEAFFHQRVRAAGGLSLKIAPTQAGAPDRLAIFPGTGLHLIELKTWAGRMRPIQVEWHRRASELGITIPVLRGRGEVMAWIRKQIEENYNPEVALQTTEPSPTYETVEAERSEQEITLDRVEELRGKISRCTPGSPWHTKHSRDLELLQETLRTVSARTR